MRQLAARLPGLGAGLLTGLVLMVLYAPVIVSALFSVVPTRQGRILWEAFSLAPYASVWQRADVLDALANTAVVAVTAALASTLLALLLAFYTRWEGAIGRRLIEAVIVLPFLLPPIVTGLALLVATAELGIGRGLGTIAVGHTLFVLAIAYRLVANRLAALPPSLVEASADLGASRLQTLRHVLLPHLASALVTGALLSLTLSFDETLITTFVAGDETTLPLRLWAMMRVGFTPEINALVTLVLAISILLAIITALRLRPKGEPSED